MSNTLWILAQSQINLNLSITIYDVNLIYFLQKFQNIGWYTGMILVQLTPKNMESTPIFPKRFFFHPQKKNRSIGLWRGREGTVCGYGEKNKPYPFDTSVLL